MNKNGNSKKVLLKAILAVVGVAMIFVAILLISNFVNQDINQLSIKGVPLYTWFNEEKLSYSDNAVLVFDRNNIATELRIDGEKQAVDTTPYFFENERKVLFPQEMIIVQPRVNNGQQNKLPSLTTLNGISIEPKIEFADQKTALGSAFLFDGGDLYFFINPMKLSFNENEIELTPFSFVTLNFNHELYIYDYEAKTAEYHQDITSAKATTELYTVDLVTDTFEVSGKSRLLVQNVDALELLR